MAKKLLTFALAAMLIVTFAVTASARTLVLDLSEEFDSFADTGESPYLMQSGSPEFVVDGGALWMERRTVHYDNFDFVINAGDGGVTTGESRRLVGDPNLPDGDYILEVELQTFDNTILQIATAREADWVPIVTAAEGAQTLKVDVPFTVKSNDDSTLRREGAMANCKVMVVTSEDGDKVNTTAIKFWTAEDSAAVDFAVVSAKIYSVAAGGGEEATPPPPTPSTDGGATTTTGGNNFAVESDKQETDTGLGGVAVASAIALVAAGAVVFSRKKK
ncbi:MAG: hypothetical protein FWG70_07005 [Oscillospiraceae bacterium]|nr:hypothetical protein [Oscillospiraceae bacterium]